jgi:hypothetical protein
VSRNGEAHGCGDKHHDEGRQCSSSSNKKGDDTDDSDDRRGANDHGDVVAGRWQRWALVHSPHLSPRPGTPGQTDLS